MNWTDYYLAKRTEPLHPLFDLLEPLLPSPGLAYDLGCGQGKATLWLAEKGWNVVAVDQEPEGLEELRDRLPPDAKVEVMQAPMESLQLKPCDLVLMNFSWFFVPEPGFSQIGEQWQAAIRPGGIWMGQILGPEDSWVERGYTTRTRAEVESCFAGWHLHHLEEVCRPGKTVTGDSKHWHVFHVLAQRP